MFELAFRGSGFRLKPFSAQVSFSREDGTTRQKKRIADAVRAAQPSTSLADIGRILEAAGVVDDKAKIYREVGEHVASISTPYGGLFADLDLPRVDGTTYKWTIANPFALIHFLSVNCAAYAGILCSALQNTVGGIAMWGRLGQLKG